MRHLPRLAAQSLIGTVLLMAAVVLLVPPPARPAPVPTAPTGAAEARPTTTAGAAPASSPLATVTSNDSAAMLRVHQELRAAIGAPLLFEHPRVTAAAQRHAEYLVLNATGGHEETAGSPGFTGASVRDRLLAQGHGASLASEVATSVGPGTAGVRSLWILPYHRLGLMHPQAVIAGWGHAGSGGHEATVGVIVYDFESPAPALLRSPAPGQRVAGAWDGREFPDLLPPGAFRPVGHPVMLMASAGRPVDLRGARITGPNGETVPHHVVPVIYERDYVAIVPMRPLDRGTRYRVRLDLTIAGIDLVDEWEFETDR